MIPRGSYIFPLKPGTKEPSISGGHLSAVLAPKEGIPKDNYGIRLDGQYIVVDIDREHPDRDAFEASLPRTWAQRTANRDAKAIHYLYTVPKGYTGSGKRVWLGKDGTRFADIKAKGYIVGPGSVVNGNEYIQATDSEPVPAPQWLLDFNHVELQEDSNIISIQCGGIPKGDHDSFLHREASRLRGQLGLSEEAIFEYLRKGPLAVLQDMDSNDPYQDKDLHRIAHSAASYDAKKPLELLPWRTANELPEHQPMREWILDKFIPQNKLTLQFGTGGIGKSTWVPFLVAKLLRRGMKVGFSATEETFEHFSNGVRLGMPDFKKEYFDNLYDIDNHWKFSRDEEDLRKKLETCRLDFIYFDSIYDNFNVKRGLYEDTRASLSPLSKIAEEMKVSIFGTFHENKGKTYNGSKEMESVPRSLIRAVSKDDRLRLHVQKINGKKPDYDLLVVGDYIPETDPDGSPVLQKNEEGVISQDEIFIVRELKKIERMSEDEEKEYDLPKDKEDPLKLLKEELETNPNSSISQLETSLNWSTKKVRYWKDLL